MLKPLSSRMIVFMCALSIAKIDCSFRSRWLTTVILASKFDSRALPVFLSSRLGHWNWWGHIHTIKVSKRLIGFSSQAQDSVRLHIEIKCTFQHGRTCYYLIISLSNKFHNRYIAPSGVQKERIEPTDIFVLPYPAPSPQTDRVFLRRPKKNLKESACTPLFWNAFDLHDAGSCVHTHSQHAVMATLLWPGELFEISHQEVRIFFFSNILI